MSEIYRNPGKKGVSGGRPMVRLGLGLRLTLALGLALGFGLALGLGLGFRLINGMSRVRVRGYG